MNTPEVYTVGGRCPWGDASLVHGITSHLPALNGIKQMERTGPIVPAFTSPFSSRLIVTEESSRALDASGLGRFVYRPIQYANVVAIPWHEWSVEAEVPEAYRMMRFSEHIMNPERHDPSIVSRMPRLFEVVTEFELPVHFDGRWKGDFSKYKGEHLMTAISGPVRQSMVTKAAMDWLQRNGGEWLQFTRFGEPKPQTIDVRSKRFPTEDTGTLNEGRDPKAKR